MFYLFEQNNSGGQWIIDHSHGVAEILVIEALSTDGACDRLFEIGYKVKNFLSFCDCCGYRWETDNDDIKQYESFQSVIAELEKRIMCKGKKVFIHFMDGVFRGYNLQ